MFGKYRVVLLVFWGILLLVSLLALALGLQRASRPIEVSLPPLLQPEAGEDGGPAAGGDEGAAQEASWTLALSVFTAVISAAGFIGTTFFALRSDRRQAALHDLQVANLRAEIERQELEIERLWREQAAPPDNPA